MEVWYKFKFLQLRRLGASELQFESGLDDSVVSHLIQTDKQHIFYCAYDEIHDDLKLIYEQLMSIDKRTVLVVVINESAKIDEEKVKFVSNRRKISLKVETQPDIASFYCKKCKLWFDELPCTHDRTHPILEFDPRIKLDESLRGREFEIWSKRIVDGEKIPFLEEPKLPIEKFSYLELLYNNGLQFTLKKDTCPIHGKRGIGFCFDCNRIFCCDDLHFEHDYILFSDYGRKCIDRVEYHKFDYESDEFIVLQEAIGLFELRKTLTDEVLFDSSAEVLNEVSDFLQHVHFPESCKSCFNKIKNIFDEFDIDEAVDEDTRPIDKQLEEFEDLLGLKTCMSKEIYELVKSRDESDYDIPESKDFDDFFYGEAKPNRKYSLYDAKYKFDEDCFCTSLIIDSSFEYFGGKRYRLADITFSDERSFGIGNIDTQLVRTSRNGQREFWFICQKPGNKKSLVRYGMRKRDFNTMKIKRLVTPYFHGYPKVDDPVNSLVIGVTAEGNILYSLVEPRATNSTIEWHDLRIKFDGMDKLNTWIAPRGVKIQDLTFDNVDEILANGIFVSDESIYSSGNIYENRYPIVIPNGDKFVCFKYYEFRLRDTETILLSIFDLLNQSSN